MLWTHISRPSRLLGQYGMDAAQAAAIALRIQPVHIITNDEAIYYKLESNWGLYYTVGTFDYTEDDGAHYHLYIEWPVAPYSRRLSPSRESVVRRLRTHYIQDARSRTVQRCICYGKGHNYKCQQCGYWYKFIWCADSEHSKNTKAYIQAKWEDHPEWNLDYIRSLPDGSESD